MLVEWECTMESNGVKKIAQQSCDLSDSVEEAEDLFWEKLRAQGYTESDYSTAGETVVFIERD